MNRQTTIYRSAAAAIALALGSIPVLGDYYDLTISANVSAQVNGAYFFNRGSTNVIETATGTGLFNTFLAVSDGNDANNKSAIGYNVGNNTVMPEVDAAKTEYMRVGPGSFGTDVILTEPDATLGEGAGQAFYSFGLDINEPNSNDNPWLSLDKVEIYVSPNQLANGTTKANLLALGSLTKVYDMDLGAGGDSSVLIDYRISSSGSGRADLALLVPKANFTNVAGINANWYVYFYTEMGDVGTTFAGRDYGENAGGFEEWGTLKGFTFYVPPVVPEASTFAAVGGVGLTFLGYAWTRRRQRRN